VNRPRPTSEDHDVTDWVYRLVVRTALGLFRVLGFRFTIEGEEHVPEVGGAVVVSNHVSYFDFMFVGLATRPHHRLVRFMAKKSIFDNPVSGPLMRGMHHIPVDRGAGASAYAAAVEALRAGELVGVFPESTISRSFQLREIKSGAARMAIEAGVPVLPIVTWGGQRVWTSGHKPEWHRKVPVTLRIGAPIPVTPETTAASLTEAVRTTLVELIREVQRDYPAPLPGTPDWWQPAYLGGSAPTPDAAREIEEAAAAGKLERRARKAERRAAKAQRRAGRRG
jgi:1-acyl-sn-glycerol-3-phosphate acyltransferase